MDNIGATYVLVGNRDIDHLSQSIKLLRNFSPSIPVIVYLESQKQIDLISKHLSNITFKLFERLKYPTREENRNSSTWRLKALLESPFENTLYIDNDIYVVHKGFFEGFNISENYGVSMVQNPRMFISTYEQDIGDIDIGADVQLHDKTFIKDMPKYMTSLNMGVIFYNKKSEPFIKEVLAQQLEYPSRGQASLARAIWKTKTQPYTLPINWLVCKKHKGIERPLALHVGHKNIYDWWKESFDKEPLIAQKGVI